MLKIHKEGRFEKIPICDNCDQLIPQTFKNWLARIKYRIMEAALPNKNREKIIKLRLKNKT